MSRALRGLKAPGKRRSSPDASRSRKRRRFSAAGTVEYSISGPLRRSRVRNSGSFGGRMPRHGVSRHPASIHPEYGTSVRRARPSEEVLRGRRAGEDAELSDDRELLHLLRRELGKALREVEEALDLVLREHRLGEEAELADVILARERPCAQGMRVGDGDLLDDLAAV